MFRGSGNDTKQHTAFWEMLKAHLGSGRLGTVVRTKVYYRQAMAVAFTWSLPHIRICCGKFSYITSSYGTL